MSVKLNLVVAMCNNKGIGIAGRLPWRIKGDMAFFKQLTLQTTNPDKINVVIMGRKTWTSIPEKFRPLPQRINVVISRTIHSVPEGVHVARNFNDAINLVTTPPLCDTVEKIFIVGGASVYEAAIGSSYPCRLYLTRIFTDIKCDTFMPDLSDFKQIECSDIDSTVKKENGYEYKFEVYEKCLT